jgi:hypothetical protein
LGLETALNRRQLAIMLPKSPEGVFTTLQVSRDQLGGLIAPGTKPRQQQILQMHVALSRA